MKLKRVEDVTIKTDNTELVIKARVDTGADRTSIDLELANELGLGLLNEFKKVKSANGISKRQLVEFNYLLKGRLITTKANVTDRSKLSYKMIIGCNDLTNCEVII